MKQSAKKIFAKEIIIFNIVIGFIGLLFFIIWANNQIINNKIEDILFKIEEKVELVDSLNIEYNEKFLEIKSFISLIRKYEEKNFGSVYELFLMLGIPQNEENQHEYDFLNLNDTSYFQDCFCRITDDNKWSKYIVLSDEDFLEIWNCLLDKKRVLYYLAPINVHIDLSIDNNKKFIEYIDEISFSKEVILNRQKAIQIQSEINILTIELENLNTRLISKKTLTK